MNVKSPVFKGLIAMSCIAFVGTVSFLALKNNATLKAHAGECLKHDGNHYTALLPSEESSGTKEYYACCQCHKVILANEHVEGDGTWHENGQAKIVDSSHRAYDAMYHSIHGRFSGKEHWSDVKLTQNPSKATEYMILNLGLTKGDEFVIRMDGDNWYHYNDVKDGCKSYVSASGDNMVINETGNYDIYCDTASTDGHIWINKITTNEPRLVGNFSDPAWSYDEGLAMTKTGNQYNIEVEVDIGTTVKITDVDHWYGNWDTSDSENNAYSYTCFTIDGSGNARFNVRGRFNIYFTKEGSNPTIFIKKVNVESPFSTIESFGSYTDRFLLNYQLEKSSTHDKVTYLRSNQQYWSDQNIQVGLYNEVTEKYVPIIFAMGSHTDSKIFKWYQDKTYSYFVVSEQVKNCTVSLYYDTSTMTYTVDIV